MGEQEYAEKKVEDLRIVGKVLKEDRRVRLLALGAYRLVTIKKRVTGLCVLREFHIHDLEAIRREEGRLKLSFRKGFEQAFEMSVPWTLPFGADLATCLRSAWIDSGGSLLQHRPLLVEGLFPQVSLEDPDCLEVALYKRLRDYDGRRPVPDTVEALLDGPTLHLNALSKGDLKAVCGVLRHSSKFAEIVARKCAEDSDELLASSRSATRVSIDSGIKTIASLSPSLTSLDLSHNNLGDRGAALLAASAPRSLRALILSRCRLKPSLDVGGFVQLCASLSQRTPLLEYLDLSHNSLGQTGACCLAWLLRTSSCRLRVLSVADNKSPVSSMLATISESQSLTWLDISNNTLKDPAADCAALASFSLQKLKISNMRYATTLSYSSIPSHHFKRALDVKSPHLHASANYLSFDREEDKDDLAVRETLFADDLPVASPAIFAQAKQMSLKRCASWNTLETIRTRTRLVKLTVSDSRGLAIDVVVDSLPNSLRTLDVSGCCGGDAALFALSRYLLRGRDQENGGRLERLACDGQRRISLAGLEDLADGIDASTHLVDLWPPLEDAERAAGAEKIKEKAVAIATTMKRMRRRVSSNNGSSSSSSREWASLCSNDDGLSPEQVPESLATSTKSRATWDIEDPDWFAEYYAGGSATNTDDDDDDDTFPPPPPPPSCSDDEDWSPPPSRAPPTPPAVHLGDGVLGAIQRGASSFRSSLEELPEATSHLVDNVHQTTTNLGSAVDSFLGRRRQLYASDTEETDDEEFDEDDDW